MAIEPRMISFLHVDMKKNDLRELQTREKERRVKRSLKRKEKESEFTSNTLTSARPPPLPFSEIGGDDPSYLISRAKHVRGQLGVGAENITLRRFVRPRRAVRGLKMLCPSEPDRLIRFCRLLKNTFTTCSSFRLRGIFVPLLLPFCLTKHAFCVLHLL